MPACGLGAACGALRNDLWHNALNMTSVLSGRKGRDWRKKGDARHECGVAPLLSFAVAAVWPLSVRPAFEQEEEALQAARAEAEAVWAVLRRWVHFQQQE